MARYISIPLWKQHRSTLDQHAKPEYRSGLAYLHDYNSAERLDVTVHVPPGRMQPIDSPMIFKGLAWRGGLPSDSVCDSLGTWNPKTNLT
jgi:hypothetical protein